MPKPTTIRTKRLLLRPFAFKDVNDVQAYASDPEWSRFLPVPDPYTLQDAEEFVAKNVLRNPDEGLGFAIELSSVVIGGIDLRLEASIAVGSLHYSISRAHWNKDW